MPSFAEVASSLYGAWCLVKRDSDGMRWFNLSVTGFWRSFFAAAIILPFYVGFAWLDATKRAEEAEQAAAPVDEAWLTPALVGYVAAWVATPLVLLALAKLLDRTRAYAAMVIASNWVAVPEFAILAAASLLALAVPALAGILLIGGLAAVLMIDYFVARIAFQVGPGQAVAVVAVTFLTTLVIDFVLGPGP
jgi:hypothetical protein